MDSEEKNDASATTTHTEWGDGHPRLLISSQGSRFVSELLSSETTIGADSTCSIRLPELRPLHATITHNEQDEYVLAVHHDQEVDAEEPGNLTQTLRSGSSFTAGPWSFLFSRDVSA